MTENMNQKGGRSRSAKKWMGWGIVVALVAVAALFAYCSSLFQELEGMMAQNPHSQPSIIYSDAYVVRKDDLVENSFLAERLSDLRQPFAQSATELRWQSQA